MEDSWEQVFLIRQNDFVFGHIAVTPTILWFRQDLRLSDQPALAAAVERGGPIIPVYIWAPEEEGVWPPGAASRWWLGRSLAALDAGLKKHGSRLIIRRDQSAVALNQLITETGASAVFWNRRYEPAGVARDRAVKSALRERGMTAESFHGNLLFEPWTIKNSAGQPFRVFTAFWKSCLQQTLPAPVKDTPIKKLPAPAKWPHSLALSDLALEPTIDWAGGLRDSWQPGETGAQKQLERFRKDALEEYSSGRDRPGIVGTSRLSPHLHFGEISPAQIWHAASGSDAYLRQLGWREFAHHLLFHNPESPEQALRHEFNDFTWKPDPKALAAWQRGRTGYPLVDAGMRELWHTGWMHNRVRMVVASFLVKHLLIAWQEGAAWFWDTLVDADLANNTLGWQWVAGCGTDAAPYFRIFNPVLQGEKFDPAGEYVRHWVPELATVPDKWIHRPWEAPVSVPDYPLPIVDHKMARKRALAAFASITHKSAS
jgi:deoxyribodipyrimidine photo-lyase